MGIRVGATPLEGKSALAREASHTTSVATLHVRGISSGTADQVLKLGIKVTDVNPGPVNTDYWGERAVPREKFLSPEDVAGVIRFVVTLPEHVLIQEINFNSLNWMMK